MVERLSADSRRLPDYDALAGTWESPELELLSVPGGNQLFLSRAFDFDAHAWRVRFSAWADPQRKNRLFDGVGEGHLELAEPWAAVPGARAAIFHFARRLFTIHTRLLADQLTLAGAGSESWAPGIQQDISRTGALFVPAIADVSAEYDLVAFDRSPGGESDLYLGDRSHELNSAAHRPTKRIAWPVRKVI
jgi:hypothetical protein